MDGDEVCAIHAVVQGLVQGVGFRDYVYSRAHSLQLTGYVQNLPDGRSLEVIAEGPPEALERLIMHLRNGPRSARVDTVDVEWREPEGGFGDFGVRF